MPHNLNKYNWNDIFFCFIPSILIKKTLKFEEEIAKMENGKAFIIIHSFLL